MRPTLLGLRSPCPGRSRRVRRAGPSRHAASLIGAVAFVLGGATGCWRAAAPNTGGASAGASGAAAEPALAAPPASASARATGPSRPAALASGSPCRAARPSDAPPCARFASAEEAFSAVVAATEPLVLAVGEAHAQRGTEAVASATKRFTTSLLPLLEGRATDVVVELWAPDPRCQREVKAVATAQRPVTTAQASSNVNEYEVLGVRAKALGATPWLLRPTCDDFTMLADAGDGAIAAMLGLVKRLTSAKVQQLVARGRDAAEVRDTPANRMVVAYGGMMHNDLFPPEATRDYTFGPELASSTGGRYVELDLVVPEYVKATPSWQALPWYAAFEVDGPDAERATLYAVGERSFVLIFPRSP